MNILLFSSGKQPHRIEISSSLYAVLASAHLTLWLPFAPAVMHGFHSNGTRKWVAYGNHSDGCEHTRNKVALAPPTSTSNSTTLRRWLLASAFQSVWCSHRFAIAAADHLAFAIIRTVANCKNNSISSGRLSIPRALQKISHFCLIISVSHFHCDIDSRTQRRQANFCDDDDDDDITCDFPNRNVIGHTAQQ